MSETASISSSIARRYGAALFELAKETGSLSDLEADTSKLSDALDAGGGLGDMIVSPVYTREEQGAAIGAVCEKIGVSALTGNTLGLMASKRRLFVLPQLLSVLRDMIADEKGEVTADVISAEALTSAQESKLVETLKDRVGKNIVLKKTVDESLIGGLVVRVGSIMIDSSIRSKLANLQNAMKEVG